MAENFPVRTEKPWGYELLFACTDRYAGKVIFVKKGHRLSLQYHKEKDEAIHLVSGKALIELENKNGEIIRTEALPGYCFRVPPMTRHRMTALEDTTFFEVSTPELNDVERLEDDYGRS